jgi:hypothetical protein
VIVRAESHSRPNRPSERERSHLTPYRCEGCGRQFAPKRRWQRSCGLPRCRAAPSRRRRADELRNELEGIAEALDQDNVETARAKLQALISTLRDRRARY